MASKCDYKNDTIRGYIALIKETRKFQIDGRASEYLHTRITLGLIRLAYINKLRRANKEGVITQESGINRISPYDLFNSCSQDELAGCLEGRHKWIAEYEQVTSNDWLKNEYPNIYKVINDCIERDKQSIEVVLEIQKIMQEKGIRNWDSMYMQTV